MDQNGEYKYSLLLWKASTDYIINVYSKRKAVLQSMLLNVDCTSKEMVAYHESNKQSQENYDYRSNNDPYLKACKIEMKNARNELFMLLKRTYPNYIKNERDNRKNAFINKYDKIIQEQWELIKTGNLEPMKRDEVRKRLHDNLKRRDELQSLTDTDGRYSETMKEIVGSGKLSGYASGVSRGEKICNR